MHRSSLYPSGREPEALAGEMVDIDVMGPQTLTMMEKSMTCHANNLTLFSRGTRALLKSLITLSSINYFEPPDLVNLILPRQYAAGSYIDAVPDP